VTEQDVVNEEMYEEEDDDLPMQYRRLTAHLQTGSSEFNRRLQDYLSTQVAMRTAYVDYTQNAQFANNHSNMQFMGNQQMQSPQQSNGPPIYRQAPYLQRQEHNMSMHQRGALSQDYNTSYVQQNSDRRASMPTIISPDNTRSSSETSQCRPSFAEGSFNPLQFNNIYSQYNMGNNGFGNNNYSQMSAQLPRESQVFLGNTLNSNDFPTSMLMANNDPSQMYDWPAAPLPESTQIGKHQSYPTTQGLNSTLAGDQPQQAQQVKKENEGQDGDEPPSATQSFYEDAIKQENENKTFSTTSTPGRNGDIWDSWLNDTYTEEGIEQPNECSYT
jgi:hypothetical protein